MVSVLQQQKKNCVGERAQARRKSISVSSSVDALAFGCEESSLFLPTQSATRFSACKCKGVAVHSMADRRACSELLLIDYPQLRCPNQSDVL